MRNDIYWAETFWDSWREIPPPPKLKRGTPCEKVDLSLGGGGVLIVSSTVNIFFSGGILCLILDKPLRPKSFYNIFSNPYKLFFCTSAGQTFFDFWWNFTQNWKTYLTSAFTKKNLMEIWKYCMKALLGLSAFIIGPKSSIISNPKKKMDKKLMTHFETLISGQKYSNRLKRWKCACTKTNLVGSWKYCIKASIQAFLLF